MTAAPAYRSAGEHGDALAYTPCCVCWAARGAATAGAEASDTTLGIRTREAAQAKGRDSDARGLLALGSPRWQREEMSAQGDAEQCWHGDQDGTRAGAWPLIGDVI